MATAEIAEVLESDAYAVREELARVARFDPVGGDGFWTLEGQGASRNGG